MKSLLKVIGKQDSRSCRKQCLVLRQGGRELLLARMGGGCAPVALPRNASTGQFAC